MPRAKGWRLFIIYWVAGLTEWSKKQCRIGESCFHVCAFLASSHASVVQREVWTRDPARMAPEAERTTQQETSFDG